MTPPISKKDGLPARVHARDGRYYFLEYLDEVSLKTGKRKIRWVALSRVSDGKAKLYESLAKAIDHPAEKVGNVRQRIAEFLKVKLPTLHSADVKKEYVRIYDKIAETFTEFNTEDVDSKDCQDFVERFMETPTMARAYKARLSTFFRWCCVKRYCADNPCTHVWLPAPPKRDIKLSPEIFYAIYDALLLGKDNKPTKTGPIAQCLMEMFYLVQQRSTEIRMLRLDQIKDGVIKFKPSKTENTSRVKINWPITPDIQLVLDRAAAIRRSYKVQSSVYVFPTPEGGPYSARRFLGIWKRACNRAGVAGFTVKDILPTSMTDAEQQGYSLEELRKARGHTTVTTTEGYLKNYREVVSTIELNLPRRPSKPDKSS